MFAEPHWLNFVSVASSAMAVTGNFFLLHCTGFCHACHVQILFLFSDAFYCFYFCHTELLLFNFSGCATCVTICWMAPACCTKFLFFPSHNWLLFLSFSGHTCHCLSDWLATGAVASNRLLLPEMLRADFFLDPFYSFYLTAVPAIA